LRVKHFAFVCQTRWNVRNVRA